MLFKKLALSALLILSGAVSIFYFIKTEGNFSNAYWAYFFQTIAVCITTIFEISSYPNVLLKQMIKNREDQIKLEQPDFDLTSPVGAVKIVLCIGAIVGAAALLVPAVIVFEAGQSLEDWSPPDFWVVFSAVGLFVASQAGFYLIRRMNKINLINTGRISEYKGDDPYKIVTRPFIHQSVMAIGLCLGSLVFFYSESVSLFIGLVVVATTSQIFAGWFADRDSQISK